MSDIEDALEVFSSSLHSLFDHVMPANGDPLELFTYNPPKDSQQPKLVCRIPPQEVNEGKDSRFEDVRLVHSQVDLPGRLEVNARRYEDIVSLFAHYVWNASLILADRISTSQIAGLEVTSTGDQVNEEEGETMSVCELGCGAGIPGLIAARSRQVRRVVLTDYADPLLIDNLKGNIELAYESDESTKEKLVALGHTWGEEESLARIIEANDNERFTHILMADTLWLTEAQTALISSLSQLLAFTPSARIHLVAGFHSGRNAVRSFLRKARQAGLEEKEVNGKKWEELAVGGKTRSWGWDLEGEVDDTEWVEEKESNSERGKWVVVGEMGWSKQKLDEVETK